MTSKKRSAKAKQIAAFKAQLADYDKETSCPSMDNLFAQEDDRRAQRAAEKDAAQRKRSCESKNRYHSQADAQEAIRLCADHGTKDLVCYRCEYCRGWHLTSHPWDA